MKRKSIEDDVRDEAGPSNNAKEKEQKKKKQLNKIEPVLNFSGEFPTILICFKLL